MEQLVQMELLVFLVLKDQLEHLEEWEIKEVVVDE